MALKRADKFILYLFTLIKKYKVSFKSLATSNRVLPNGNNLISNQ